jgi:hypothetical protein
MSKFSLTQTNKKKFTLVPYDWEDVDVPTGWTWSLPFTIQKKVQSFRVEPSFNLRNHANITITKTYYLNTITGNDAADGLTALTPNKSWTHIVNIHGDADRIIIQDGSYITRLDCLYKPNRNTEVIGEGTVWFTNDFIDYIGAWSLTVGQTHTYQCNMLYGEYVAVAADYSVLGIYGQPTAYPMKASIAEVEANAGSIYWLGGVLYCHTLDGLTPSGRTDIKYGYGYGYSITKDNLTFYFENINFTSIGIYNLSAAGGLKVYLRDCTSSAYTIAGVSEIILQNCRSTYCGTDIMNIGSYNGIESNVIEIDCEFSNVIGAGNDQASTGHQASNIVRISGLYHNASGQCIADVDNCMTWMLGCHLDLSVISKTGFYFGGTKAWLDMVHISNCADYDIVSEAGTDVYHRNCTFEKGVNSISGTYSAY